MNRIYFSILIFSCIFSISQNLVPNYSFETYTICPNAVGQIESAVPWTAAISGTSSTDYYNECSNSNVVGIPNNQGGFQYARTSNAYAGLLFYAGSGAREYLQVQLTNFLIQNRNYYVEFYVNSANANWNSASNNIAANLSVIRPYTTTFGVLQSLTPHIMNPGNPVIDDTLNWVKISGCYTAQGGEEYLTIGNFFNNANTVITGSTGVVYYYVDDVTVEEITGTCVTGIKEENDEKGLMRLYPNPASESLSLTLSVGKGIEPDKCVISITDVLGREVLVSEYKERLDVSHLESGVYFLSIQQQDSKLSGTKKFIKQ